MNSHLMHTLAAERSQDLRRAADRSLLARHEDAGNGPNRWRERIARLRTRVARRTPRVTDPGSRVAETGS